MLIFVRHYNKFTGMLNTFIICAKTYNYAQQGPRYYADHAESVCDNYIFTIVYPPLICINNCVNQHKQEQTTLGRYRRILLSIIFK